jgi:hypothetical protein
MSSSPPGPYKSKIFNLFNRQSLQLKDRLEKAGRHIKVALEWGVQILAYPIYLIVQTGRMAGRQLGTTVEKAKLPPVPTDSQRATPPVDTTIDRVLETVDLWLSPTSEPEASKDLADSVLPATEKQDLPVKMCTMVHISPQTPELIEPEKLAQLHPNSSVGEIQNPKDSLAVCGVASLLETHDLVLVTQDNQIVDILSSQQQKELQKRIYWEVANYWYRQRLLSKVAHPFPVLVPSFEEGSENVLPPAKLFWKAMRWMQTSQLAIAVNLFGESTIVRSDVKVATISPLNNTSIPDRSLLDMFGDRLQDLGRQPLEPLSERNLQELIQAAVNYFFGKHNSQAIPAQSPSETQQPQHLLPNLVQKVKTGLAGKSSNLNEASEPDPFQIQVLVEAALDHFFGARYSGLKSRSLLALRQQKGQHSLENRVDKVLSPQSNAIDDPWLSWDDLYAETTLEIGPKPRNIVPSQPTQLTSASAGAMPLSPAKSQKVKSKKSHSKTRRSSRLQKNRKAIQRQNPTTERPSPIARRNSTESSLEAEPDWIETKATPVGYVKHPLVRVLEWLDRVMLWLEDVLAKFWRWLRRRF